jgi:FixJ family two-component response regulator
MTAPVVYVVDDDVSVRESLEALLRWAGLNVRAFSTASAFIATQMPAAARCLVLDIELPDINGLELQARLTGMRGELPVIVATGHATVTSSVRALKAGAVEFLTKPIDDEALLTAVRRALELSENARLHNVELDGLRLRYATLTAREREVMTWVVVGLLNKEIAERLGTSEVTVKAHRGKVMQKMETDRLPELVRFAAKLALPLPARCR